MGEGALATAPSPLASVKVVFSNRDFRLLTAGEAVSLIGDQFCLLALPWLVLQTTGSALYVGTVTGVAAVPRALFMLFGGVFVDRLSPRVVMLWSNIVRMALVAGMAVLTVTGLERLWMLYCFALCFGMGDAFYFPAINAAVPRLLASRTLLTGNAIIQGANQLAMFVGPLAAGGLIAALHTTATAGQNGDLRGVGAALGVDALSFLVSACVLRSMRMGRATRETTFAVGRMSARREILQGLRAVQRDPFLRFSFPLLAAGNFLVTGPLYVGLPLLVHVRYQGGAGALGLVLSLFGAGSLTGVVLAGLSGRPVERSPKPAMAVCPAVLGVGLALLGIVHTVIPAALLTGTMGLAQGYLVVQFITFVQRRVEPGLLGRVMSLLTFAVVGISPLSSLMAGALLEASISRLLVGAGGLLVLVVAAALLTPAFRHSGE